TDHGAVYGFPECGLFIILFGPDMLAQSRPGFYAFCELVRTLEPSADFALHGHPRCYHLHTADRRFGLALTASELEDLRELMNGAAAMDELQTIIDRTVDPSRPD
ncbi:MAG: hypothetical protein AAF970_15850, partial [Bacteroidota bacterium]